MTAEEIKHFRWKFGHKLLLENVPEVLDYLDIVYDAFQVSAKSNALCLLNIELRTHSTESTQFLGFFWPPPPCVRTKYTALN